MVPLNILLEKIVTDGIGVEVSYYRNLPESRVSLLSETFAKDSRLIQDIIS